MCVRGERRGDDCVGEGGGGRVSMWREEGEYMEGGGVWGEEGG